MVLSDHLEHKNRVLTATKTEAVVFWVMATQYLVGGYQYLMECWWTVQQQSTAIYIWDVIVKIRLSSPWSCLFEKCEYNNPQFKKWRYSLKVYHEIEISNKCQFPTIIHAIIRDTVTWKCIYIYIYRYIHTNTHIIVSKVKYNSTVWVHTEWIWCIRAKHIPTQSLFQHTNTSADCKSATGLLSVVFAWIFYIFLQEILNSSNSGKLDHPTGHAIHRKRQDNFSQFNVLLWWRSKKHT